jgi:hypothetical protein
MNALSDFGRIWSLFCSIYRKIVFFMRFAKPRQTQPKLRVEHKHQNLALQNFLSLEIDKCIRHSIDGPLMPYAIRIIPGMSGQRFRKLLNGLAQIPISGSYLEI